MPQGTADITGVRAKLQRAQVHFKALNNEFLRLSEEYAETSFIKFRNDGEWRVVLAGPIPLFPIEWSLIAGDFFNNLRAALDHLIWQIVLREGKKPKQTHAFPIFQSESAFIKKVESPPKGSKRLSPLYGIPTDGNAWAIVKRAQPWYRGKAQGFEPRKDILSTLRLMSNIDKHRTILVSMALPDQRMLGEVIRWLPEDIQPTEVRLANWEPLSHEHQTELMRIRFPTDAKVTMYMDGNLRVGPTFGDENTQIAGFGPIYERINQIVDEVAKLPRVIG